jgi:hypothetical protein
MSKLDRYRTPSATRLLRHVLESPALVGAVRELTPAALGKLIDSLGLESAGELVALASTEQLERVFDADLWREDAVGEDPRFDPGRFALWLEVLFEAGEAAVVQRLCELPLDFVSLAVERLVLVVDMDRLGVELGDDEEELDLVEKALEANPCEEWEEFRLIARDARSFDTIVTALFALDREHHALLRRILERCAAASSEYIDDSGGLYAVLTAEEMLESDARAERDDRRAADGYVAASDARSFLALARGGAETDQRDAVTRAYFRELVRERPAPPRERPAPHRERPTRGREHPQSPPRADVEGLTRLLREVSDDAVAPEAALVRAAGAPLLASALAELEASDAALYAERLEELGFLANVLVAGEPYQNRRFRPIEALETAVAVCDEGLALELASAGPSHERRLDAAVRHLRARHLDQLFRVGFARRKPQAGSR